MITKLTLNCKAIIQHQMKSMNKLINRLEYVPTYLQSTFRSYRPNMNQQFFTSCIWLWFQVHWTLCNTINKENEIMPRRKPKIFLHHYPSKLNKILSPLLYHTYHIIGHILVSRTLLFNHHIAHVNQNHASWSQPRLLVIFSIKHPLLMNFKPFTSIDRTNTLNLFQSH